MNSKDSIAKTVKAVYNGLYFCCNFCKKKLIFLLSNKKNIVYLRYSFSFD